MTRKEFAFSHEDKELIHEKGMDRCEFPGLVCDDSNNSMVHHITGAYEARLDKKDRVAITDAELNAVLLCTFHANLHDLEERYQIECLEYEIRADKNGGKRNNRYRSGHPTRK